MYLFLDVKPKTLHEKRLKSVYIFHHIIGDVSSIFRKDSGVFNETR